MLALLKKAMHRESNSCDPGVLHTGDLMLLLETVETIGAIWLAMSAVGFILFAIFGKPRQSSVTAIGRPDSAESSAESMTLAHAPAADRQLDELSATLDEMRDNSERDRRRDALDVPVAAE